MTTGTAAAIDLLRPADYEYSHHSQRRDGENGDGRLHEAVRLYSQVQIQLSSPIKLSSPAQSGKGERGPGKEGVLGEYDRRLKRAPTQKGTDSRTELGTSLITRCAIPAAPAAAHRVAVHSQSKAKERRLSLSPSHLLPRTRNSRDQ